MKMFELLPRPLGPIFRKLTHLTCNLPGDCPLQLHLNHQDCHHNINSHKDTSRNPQGATPMLAERERLRSIQLGAVVFLPFLLPPAPLILLAIFSLR